MLKGRESIRPSGDWLVEHTRFTAFGLPGKLPASPEFFEAVFGFPHDSEMRKKAELTTEFSGVAGGVIHKLTLVGPKLDLMIAPAAPDEMPTGMPTLPDKAKARTLAMRAALRIVGEDMSIFRVAVGERFVLPVESVEAGYLGLGYFLPSVEIDPVGSRDFFYRINRTREVMIADSSLAVNRLSSWGCMSMNIHVASGEVSAVGLLVNYVSVLTDVNTKPEADFKSLNVAARQDLIARLFAFSEELAEKGDVS